MKENVTLVISLYANDVATLIRAVAQSERVRSIGRLDWPVSLQPECGALAHAEGALKAWAAVDEFETTLPTEIL